MESTDRPTIQSLKPVILAKSFKKPGYSVKSLKILAGHFFHSDKFKEHFK